jgi:glycosyltransferase involved in cell wall biosynthesis
MEYAIVSHPISAEFRARFEKLIGSVPRYLEASDLGGLTPVQKLKRMATLSARHLYLLIEDESSLPMLPFWQAIAACSTARTLELVYADLRREQFSRLSVVPSLSQVGAASLVGIWNVGATLRECRKLVSMPRSRCQVGTSARVMYLKTNFWFGMKAGGSVGHEAGVLNGLVACGKQVDFYGPTAPVMAVPDVNVSLLSSLTCCGWPNDVNAFRFGRHVARQVAHRAAEARYDFIYQRMSLSNYSGVSLSRKFNIPLVLEYNASEVWLRKNWGRGLRFSQAAEAAEEACLRHAHYILTVSDVLRDELIARGVDPHRIVSYPNCIEPRVFDPALYAAESRQTLRARWNIPANAVVPMFLGTFGQLHGVPILAQAIRKLATEKADFLRKHRVHFLLVGDGALMPEVQQILAEPCCTPFVTLTGLVAQAEAPLYLATADLLLSPHVANADGSQFFGSPTKLFEYMAMAKGIVASDLEQIGQVLKNSLHADNLPATPPDERESSLALLCPPGDVDALAASICFLVEHPQWSEKLGTNARTEALKKYTWRHHVNALLERME